MRLDRTIADRALTLLAHVACRLLPADLLPAGGVTLLQPHSEPNTHVRPHDSCTGQPSPEEDTRSTTPAALHAHGMRERSQQLVPLIALAGRACCITVDVRSSTAEVQCDPASTAGLEARTRRQ